MSIGDWIIAVCAKN